MKLAEYQAKNLLAGFDLPLNRPILAQTAAGAAEAAVRVGGPVVVKAQVPFGGRGRQGGVRFAQTPDQARKEAATLLSMTLGGTRVQRVSVEPKVSYVKELYVGVTWDTRVRLPVAMLSLAGGIEVEAAGEGSIVRQTFDPLTGLLPHDGRTMAASLALSGKTLVEVGQVLAQLAEAFVALDAVMVELNPLVETVDGTLTGVDARLEIDEDALFRQKGRSESLDTIETSVAGRPPTELECEAQHIDAMDHRGVAGRVVEFDGDLGLLIGGGGASLVIFDAVRHHGGRPANYCEVGGNPTEEKVAALTALLLSKPGVRTLAVIMNVVNNTRADVMARGVIAGINRCGLSPAEVVCVFRIPGSWEAEARAILSEVGVQALGREISLDAAAKLAVDRTQQSAA